MRVGLLFGLIVWALCLTDLASAQEKRQTFQVMFYNVENLFDTYDDPDTDDNEFLPNGARHWTWGRFYSHLRQTARVILAVGEWDTPALVGMCEVENDSVLIYLTQRTQLRAQNYLYCMTESIDPRGINVALLYQADKFRLLGVGSKRIPFRDSDRRSRDILHAWGLVITGDTLDVFVCHFPSRRGGERESEPARIDAANYLRSLCDSLFECRKSANILIMGDMNDMPDNKSIGIITQSANGERALTNLFGDAAKLNNPGSYKYQGEWNQLDQMMISRSLKEKYVDGSAAIFMPDFLLTGSKSRNKQRPLHVYNGFKYEGGFSDHLPVVAVFSLPIQQNDK